MKIELDGIKFNVVITRKRIKNIYFRIKEDYNIYVNCNALCSDIYILNLLKKNKDDLLKMYNNIKAKENIKKDIYYLGERLEFIESKRIKIDEDCAYGPSIEKINDFLEKGSLSFFETRLNSLRIQFKNLPKFRLRIRKMKTRWGVCNKSSMTVTLNTELIHKDVSLIDYVLIHELCHFKHMNHSLSFWKEVEKYYPYYKLARKRLK